MKNHLLLGLVKRELMSVQYPPQDKCTTMYRRYGSDVLLLTINLLVNNHFELLLCRLKLIINLLDLLKGQSSLIRAIRLEALLAFHPPRKVCRTRQINSLSLV